MTDPPEPLPPPSPGPPPPRYEEGDDYEQQVYGMLDDLAAAGEMPPSLGVLRDAVLATARARGGLFPPPIIAPLLLAAGRAAAGGPPILLLPEGS